MSSRLPEQAALPGELVEAWRGDQPSDVDVQRAYVRFLRRRPGGSRTPLLGAARWVLTGMLLGMGSLYAATAAPLRLFGWGEKVAEPAPVKPATSAQLERARVVARPAVPSVSVSPALAPTPAPEPHPVASDPSASAPEQWQRVARAMREHDYRAAEAALTQLEAGAGDADREAAQLVRAQVLLSQGRDVDAVPLLKRLQASAQSSSVREKSTELLARPTKSAPSQRSFEPLEGTK